MDHFNFKQGELFAEDVRMSELADLYGTPCYVYSKSTLIRHFQVFDRALGESPHSICYAVKANSNINLLKILAELGAGFDIVSGGELERVLRAGGTPDKITFAGVGKLTREIERALEVGIGCFYVESEAELNRIETIAARMGQVAPIGLRVNPNIDPQTHPYIATGLKDSKFGIDIELAPALYQRIRDAEHLSAESVCCHIGSQITELSPFIDALDRLLTLLDTLEEQGISLKHLDIGGGLGVRYQNETPPEPAQYAKALLDKLAGRDIPLYFQPGRVLMANAGVLLTKVEYLKHQNHHHFAIVDAGMNDFIRPALYQGWHDVIPVTPNKSLETFQYQVVGPVCESGDFLAKDRELAISEGDYLAIRGTGAYGFVMSSNYNTRPRACEILVDGKKHTVIRRRETINQLLANEE